MNSMRTTEQEVANTLATADGALHEAGHTLSKAVDRATGKLGELAQHSADVLRHESGLLAEQAQRARRNTSAYIRHDPIRSMLIAAAVGAGVVVLMNLLRPGTRKHRDLPR